MKLLDNIVLQQNNMVTSSQDSHSAAKLCPKIALWYHQSWEWRMAATGSWLTFYQRRLDSLIRFLWAVHLIDSFKVEVASRDENPECAKTFI